MQATGQSTTHPFERFLVILGAVLCLALTIFIWRSVSAFQSMWPLPALYFIEVAALGILGAFAFVQGGRGGRVITWGAAGVFTAFSIMGAWSVGFFYLPVALIGSLIAGLALGYGKKLYQHIHPSVR